MNSPSLLYSEYIFTSLKKVDARFVDLDLHLKSLKRQVEEYYCVLSVESLMNELKSQLLNLDASNLRVRINVFAKDREEIFKDSFTESDLMFSLNTSELKPKRQKLNLKTFIYCQDQVLSKFKLPNYSSSFYLKRLAQKENYEDILYVSPSNEILESSTSNIVFRIDGEWVTSKLCIYEGISRQKLINSNKIKEQAIQLDDLDKATDAYLINSIEGFVAVKSINNKYFFNNENAMELFDE